MCSSDLVDVVRDWRKEERVVRVSTARDVHKRKWSPRRGLDLQQYADVFDGNYCFVKESCVTAGH